MIDQMDKACIKLKEKIEYADELERIIERKEDILNILNKQVS